MPLKILCSKQAKEAFESWLFDQVPNGKFEVIAWEVPESQTLGGWVEDAKLRVRKLKPDFVLLCPPRPAASDTRESMIHNYSWLMNWSLNFGAPSWDCVVVHPNVFESEATSEAGGQAAANQLLEELVAAQDLLLIRRGKSDERSSNELMASWFTEQLSD
jgi:hypothetical protein